MRMKFICIGQKLRCVTQSNIVADTINYIGADFEFKTSEWTDLVKWANFTGEDGVIHRFCLVDDSIEESATNGLNLTSGSWSCFVYGNEITSGSVATRITTNEVYFNVNAVSETSELTAIPTEVETIMAETLQIKNDTQVLKETVEAKIAEITTDEATRVSNENTRISQENAREANKIVSGSATTDSTTGTPSVSVSLTSVATGGKNIGFAFTGLKGEKGDRGLTGSTGKGLDILGYYDTLSDLQSHVTDPDIGDAYGIGTAAPYNIYVWSETLVSGSVVEAWVNNGTIQGVKGDTGAAAGFGTPTATATALESSQNPTVSVSTSSSSPDTAKVFNFTFGIPKGAKGDTGETGANGADGLTTSITMNGTTHTQSGGNINLGTVITSLAGYVTTNELTAGLNNRALASHSHALDGISGVTTAALSWTENGVTHTYNVVVTTT